MDTNRILILDFGSQYTQLIARRVREAHVYCEIQPCNWPIEKVKAFGARGIILSGSPSSVTANDAPPLNPELLELGLPILGICYGMQSLAKVSGGDVAGGGKAFSEAPSSADNTFLAPVKVTVHMATCGIACWCQRSHESACLRSRKFWT